MPAKFWPRSYPRCGKISASWQDLALLGKILAQYLFAGIYPVMIIKYSGESRNNTIGRSGGGGGGGGGEG